MDLPDDLKLPLERGAPWFYWLGGRPALDFVNTRRERWWRDVETLVTPEDLGQWIVEVGVLAEAPTLDRRTVRAARELREAINAACTSCLDRAPTPEAAIKTINTWLPRADRARRLELEPDGRPVLASVRPVALGRHALGLIALDAAEMLGTADRDRVRICASETCSARFFDRSRAGRRRWCSMQGCGNVAKARRHRARHATTKASDP